MEEVVDLGSWEFLVEFSQSFSCEVSWNVEVGVTDEEVGGGFLDVDLKHLLAKVFVDLGSITTVVDKFGEEGLESGSHVGNLKLVISGNCKFSY